MSKPRLPKHSSFVARSLSAKLLLLTIAFVMLGEVLIYSPSIGRYRVEYLSDKLEAAHLAGLTVEAAPDGRVMDELTRRLLSHAGVLAVDLLRDDQVTHMLGEVPISERESSVDLRELSFFMAILQAYQLLADANPGRLEVVGESPKNENVLVKIIIDQENLRTGMIEYSYRILLLSIIISLITATLLYGALRWLMIRPIRQLTDTMVSFHRNPEATTMAETVERSDEVGLALREFRTMQNGIRAALRQKTRLATLGTAVSKISHDLRNMLATAILVSDRLAESEDPQVQKVAPVLVRSIDRAAALCEQTLNFTHELPPLTKTRFPLSKLIDEIAQEYGTGGNITLRNQVDPKLILHADRDQFSRIIHNLCRNAQNAGAAHVDIDAFLEDSTVEVDIRDDGPGIPTHVQDQIFQPFATTANGGSGLGLAICKDLALAHGGTIHMLETGPAGTHFKISLPAIQ